MTYVHCWRISFPVVQQHPGSGAMWSAPRRSDVLLLAWWSRPAPSAVYRWTVDRESVCTYSPLAVTPHCSWHAGWSVCVYTQCCLLICQTCCVSPGLSDMLCLLVCQTCCVSPSLSDVLHVQCVYIHSTVFWSVRHVSPGLSVMCVLCVYTQYCLLVCQTCVSWSVRHVCLLVCQTCVFCVYIHRIVSWSVRHVVCLLVCQTCCVTPGLSNTCVSWSVRHVVCSVCMCMLMSKELLRLYSPSRSLPWILRYSVFLGWVGGPWGEIVSIHRTCDLELSSYLCQAFIFTLLCQNWKPTSSLLPTGLSFSFLLILPTQHQ